MKSASDHPSCLRTELTRASADGGLVNVDIQPSGALPSLLFALYQGAFAGVTAVIAIGGAAERMRVIPLLVFIFWYVTSPDLASPPVKALADRSAIRSWTTIVYNPITHWVWASSGWLFNLGASSLVV